MNRVAAAGFIFLILFINTSRAGSEIQAPGLKTFIALKTNENVIRTTADQASGQVTDYTPAGSVDTLEIISETADYYNVKYFSSGSGINKGWLRKKGDIKKFTSGPIYSLVENTLQRPHLPSPEERMTAASQHSEWNAVIRFSMIEGYVVSGMTPEMVLTVFGAPDERVRYTTSLFMGDQWTYFLAPDEDFRLTFHNGNLNIFEDRTLLSSETVENKMIRQRQVFFYPYRTLGMKVMMGGAIALIAGYNSLQHQQIVGKNFSATGSARVISKNNTGNWILIGVGFASQALGGYLFNFTPGNFKLSQSRTPSGTPLIGVSIPLTSGQ